MDFFWRTFFFSLALTSLRFFSSSSTLPTFLRADVRAATMPAAATGAAGGDGEDTIWKVCDEKKGLPNWNWGTAGGAAVLLASQRACCDLRLFPDAALKEAAACVCRPQNRIGFQLATRAETVTAAQNVAAGSMRLKDVRIQPHTKEATRAQKQICRFPTRDPTPKKINPFPNHQACAYGKDALVRDLLAASPPAASTPDGDGYSPLQWAALNGRVSTVTLLVSAGADVA